MEYAAQAARDAAAAGCEPFYVEYLEQHARKLRDWYLRQGDPVSAERMMTRTLSESLAGNDGD